VHAVVPIPRVVKESGAEVLHSGSRAAISQFLFASFEPFDPKSDATPVIGVAIGVGESRKENRNQNENADEQWLPDDEVRLEKVHSIPIMIP